MIYHLARLDLRISLYDRDMETADLKEKYNQLPNEVKNLVKKNLNFSIFLVKIDDFWVSKLIKVQMFVTEKIKNLIFFNFWLR